MSARRTPDRNECRGCDGFGIMTLTRGHGRTTAPCLMCSPNKCLIDLEAFRNKVSAREELDRERALIAEHNARLAASTEKEGA